jgi:hypothetical protein
MAFHLDYAKPVLFLMIGFLVFSAMITISLSRLDAIMHYDYVLTLDADCWGSTPSSPQGNTNPICVDEYNKLGIPQGSQSQIPNAYNQSMNQNLIIIAGAIGGIWILVIGFLCAVLKKGRPSAINIYFVFVILATIALPPMTAFGDWLYFYWLNLPEPTSWSWLNSDGVFPFILSNITHDQNVTQNDMFIAMGIGGIAIIAIWIPIIVVYAQAKKTELKELLFED